MWKAAFTGKSESGSVAGSSKRKKSSSGRAESVVSSRNGDEEDREHRHHHHHRSDRSAQGGDGDTRSSSSLYATAPSSRAGVRTGSLTESAVRALGEEDWIDDENDARSGRRSKRGSSREREKKRKSRSEKEQSRSRSRSREREKRRESQSNGHNHHHHSHKEEDRKEKTRSKSYYEDDAVVASGSSRSIPAAGSFDQFTQTSGALVRPVDSTMSGALPTSDPAHQFPEQNPTTFSRPQFPLSRAQSYGEAAEYYLDEGQSVLFQPGVRTATPNMLVNPDTHLIAASAEAHPAEDTGHGSAADFYSGKVSPVLETPAAAPSKPSRSSSGSLGKLSAKAGALLGAGKKPRPTSRMDDFDVRSTPIRRGTEPTAVSSNGGVHYAPQSQRQPLTGAKGKQPISHTNPNLPVYAAGAAAAAGVAAYEMNLSSQQHNTSRMDSKTSYRGGFDGSTSYYGGVGGAPPSPPGPPIVGGNYMDAGSSRSLGDEQLPYHEHKGAMTRLKDGLLNLISDPEDVQKMEEYTEYIGVCKHCFDPRSNPHMAPRQHHYHRRRDSFEDLRRRRSNDRLGHRGSSEYLRRTGSTRVDKDTRYYGAADRRSSNKAEIVGAGLAAAGVAAGANALFNDRKDFDDVYSVKSGHRASSALRHRSRSSSRERRRRSSHGVISDREDFVTVRTKDGRVEKRRVTQRSRSRSQERKSNHGVIGAALGAAVGATAGSAIAGSSRQSNGGPPVQGAWVRPHSRSRSRSHSPGLGEISGFTDTSTSRRRDRQQPNGSYERRAAEQQSGILGGFFSPSQNQRKERRRSKEHRQKKSGFFNFGNGSSSSSDVDMAFGDRFSSKSNLPLRRKPSARRVRRSSNEHLAATVAGIGATAAALAAAQKGQRISKRSSRTDLVTGRDRRDERSRHHAHPGHQHGSPGSSNEDEWEDEVPSGGESALAFGESRLSHRQSMESVSSGDGLGAWGWRWGGKDKKKQRRPSSPPSRYPSRPEDALLPAAAAGALDAYGRPVRPSDSAMTSSTSIPQTPLQYVDPRPISEADSRHASMPGAFEPEVPHERPGPAPIQHPKPIAPVTAAFVQSPPPMDERPRPRRTASSPPQSTGTFAQDAALIGGAALVTAGIIANSGRKSKEASNVRFGLTEEQQRREARDRRRERANEDEERRRADRTRALKEEAERHAKEEDARRREQEVMRTREEENRRAAEAELERQHAVAREREEQAEIDRQRQESQRRELEYRREQERLADEARQQETNRRQWEEMAAEEAAQNEAQRRAERDRRDHEIEAEILRKRKELEMYQARPEIEREERQDYHDMKRDERRPRHEAQREVQAHSHEPSNGPSWGSVAAGAAAAATVGAVMAGAEHGRHREHDREKEERFEQYAEGKALRHPIQDEKSTDSFSAQEILPEGEASGTPIIDDDIFDRDFFKRKRSGSENARHVELARKAADKVVADMSDYYAQPAQSQADFFAPKDILSQPSAGKTKVMHPHGDNEVQVYHAAERDIQPRFHNGGFGGGYEHLPYGVPSLNVIAPTPPPDTISSSMKDKHSRPESPLARGEVAEPAQDEPAPTTTGAPTGKRDKRSMSISWGEDKTHVYDPPTPETVAEHYASPSNRDVPHAPLDEVVVEATSPGSGETKTTSYRPDDLSQGEGASESTGFPGFAADDVEEITPDTTPSFSRQPFFDSASSAAFGGFIVDSPGTEGAPPVRGFVEGETDEPTPSEEQVRHIPGGFDDDLYGGDEDEHKSNDRQVEIREPERSTEDLSAFGAESERPVWEAPLSKKDKKKRDKVAKRGSTHDGIGSQPTTPLTVESESAPSMPSVATEEPADYFTSKKDKKKRDKAAKRASTLESMDSEPVTPVAERDSEQSFREVASVPEEEPADYSTLSKKDKKKRDKAALSGQVAALESMGSEPNTPVVAEPESYEDQAVTVQEGEPTEYFTSKKDKKKKGKAAKRSSTFDDMDNEAPPPVVAEREQRAGEPVVAEEDEPADYFMSKKDKKKREKAALAKRAATLESIDSEPSTDPAGEAEAGSSGFVTPQEGEPAEFLMSKKDKKKREKALKRGLSDVSSPLAPEPKRTETVDDPYSQDTSTEAEVPQLSKKEQRQAEKEARNQTVTDVVGGAAIASGLAAAAANLEDTKDDDWYSPSGNKGKKGKKKARESERDIRDIQPTFEPPAPTAQSPDTQRNIPGGWDADEHDGRDGIGREMDAADPVQDASPSSAAQDTDFWTAATETKKSKKKKKRDSSRFNEPAASSPLRSEWNYDDYIGPQVAEPAEMTSTEPEEHVNGNGNRADDTHSRDGRQNVMHDSYPENESTEPYDRDLAEAALRESADSGRVRHAAPESMQDNESERHPTSRKSRSEVGYEDSLEHNEDRSTAPSEPAGTFDSDKRSRRRSTHDDDDTASVVSSRSRREPEEPTTKKEKKSGLFGLFSRKSSEAVPVGRQSTHSDESPLTRTSTRDSKDGDEDDGERKHRRKKHREDSVYGDDDDTRSVASSESRHRHRHHRDDQDDETRERRRSSHHVDDDIDARSESGHRHRHRHHDDDSTEHRQHHRRRTDEDTYDGKDSDQSFLGVRVEDLPPLPASPVESPVAAPVNSEQGAGTLVLAEPEPHNLSGDYRSMVDQELLDSHRVVRNHSPTRSRRDSEPETENLPALPVSRPGSPTARTYNTASMPEPSPPAFSREVSRNVAQTSAPSQNYDIEHLPALPPSRRESLYDIPEEQAPLPRAASSVRSEHHREPVPGPTVLEDHGELEHLPALPLSRPESPVAILETPARPAPPQRPTSTTAVPFRFPFRHHPPTPRERAASFSSPISQASASPASAQKKNRPLSSEIRPLYLVERNRKPQEVEDSLPSLPSSKPSSRASSIHGSDEWHSAAEDPPSPEREKKLRIDTHRPREYGADDEYLDSEETTPKASDFSQVPFERPVRQQPQFYTWEDFEQDERLHSARPPSSEEADFNAQQSQTPSFDAEQEPANSQKPTANDAILFAPSESDSSSFNRSEQGQAQHSHSVKGVAAAAMLGSAAVFAHRALRDHEKSDSDEQAGIEERSKRAKRQPIQPPLPALEDDAQSPRDASEESEREERPALLRRGSSKKKQKGKKAKRQQDKSVEEQTPSEDFHTAEATSRSDADAFLALEGGMEAGEMPAMVNETDEEAMASMRQSDTRDFLDAEQEMEEGSISNGPEATSFATTSATDPIKTGHDNVPLRRHSISILTNAEPGNADTDLPTTAVLSHPDDGTRISDHQIREHISLSRQAEPDDSVAIHQAHDGTITPTENGAQQSFSTPLHPSNTRNFFAIEEQMEDGAVGAGLIDLAISPDVTPILEHHLEPSAESGVGKASASSLPVANAQDFLATERQLEEDPTPATEAATAAMPNEDSRDAVKPESEDEWSAQPKRKQSKKAKKKQKATAWQALDEQSEISEASPAIESQITTTAELAPERPAGALADEGVAANGPLPTQRDASPETINAPILARKQSKKSKKKQKSSAWEAYDEDSVPDAANATESVKQIAEPEEHVEALTDLSQELPARTSDAVFEKDLAVVDDKDDGIATPLAPTEDISAPKLGRKQSKKSKKQKAKAWEAYEDEPETADATRDTTTDTTTRHIETEQTLGDSSVYDDFELATAVIRDTKATQSSAQHNDPSINLPASPKIESLVPVNTIGTYGSHDVRDTKPTDRSGRQSPLMSTERHDVAHISEASSQVLHSPDQRRSTSLPPVESHDEPDGQIISGPEIIQTSEVKSTPLDMIDGVETPGAAFESFSTPQEYIQTPDGDDYSWETAPALSRNKSKKGTKGKVQREEEEAVSQSNSTPRTTANTITSPYEPMSDKLNENVIAFNAAPEDVPLPDVEDELDDPPTAVHLLPAQPKDEYHDFQRDQKSHEESDPRTHALIDHMLATQGPRVGQVATIDQFSRVISPTSTGPHERALVESIADKSVDAYATAHRDGATMISRSADMAADITQSDRETSHVDHAAQPSNQTADLDVTNSLVGESDRRSETVMEAMPSVEHEAAEEFAWLPSSKSSKKNKKGKKGSPSASLSNETDLDDSTIATSSDMQGSASRSVNVKGVGTPSLEEILQRDGPTHVTGQDESEFWAPPPSKEQGKKGKRGSVEMPAFYQESTQAEHDNVRSTEAGDGTSMAPQSTEDVSESFPATPASEIANKDTDDLWAALPSKKKGKKGKKLKQIDSDNIEDVRGTTPAFSEGVLAAAAEIETDASRGAPYDETSAYGPTQRVASPEAAELPVTPQQPGNMEQDVKHEAAALPTEAVEDLTSRWSPLPSKKKGKKGKKGKQSTLDTFADESEPNAPADDTTADTAEPAHEAFTHNPSENVSTPTAVAFEDEAREAWSTTVPTKGKKSKRGKKFVFEPEQELEPGHEPEPKGERDAYQRMADGSRHDPSHFGADVESTAPNYLVLNDTVSNDDAFADSTALHGLDASGSTGLPSAGKLAAYSNEESETAMSTGPTAEPALTRTDAVLEPITPVERSATGANVSDRDVVQSSSVEANPEDEFSGFSVSNKKKKGKKGKRSQAYIDTQEESKGNFETNSDVLSNPDIAKQLQAVEAVAEPSVSVQADTPADDDFWSATTKGKKGKKGKKSKQAAGFFEPDSTGPGGATMDVQNEYHSHPVAPESSEAMEEDVGLLDSTAIAEPSQPDVGVVKGLWNTPISDKKGKKGKKGKKSQQTLDLDPDWSENASPAEFDKKLPGSNDDSRALEQSTLPAGVSQYLGSQDEAQNSPHTSAVPNSDSHASLDIAPEDSREYIEKAPSTSSQLSPPHLSQVQDKEAIEDLPLEPSSTRNQEALEAEEDANAADQPSQKEKRQDEKDRSMSGAWAIPAVEDRPHHDLRDAETHIATGSSLADKALSLGLPVAVAAFATTVSHEDDIEDKNEEDTWAGFSTKRSKKEKRRSNRTNSATPAGIVNVEHKEDTSNARSFEEPVAAMDTEQMKAGISRPAVTAEPANIEEQQLEDPATYPVTTERRHAADVPDLGHDKVAIQDDVERSVDPPGRSNDVDFAATLAAGLADSGFDPALVVEDPSFHRRSSPPGFVAEADPDEVFTMTTTKRSKKGKKDKRDLELSQGAVEIEKGRRQAMPDTNTASGEFDDALTTSLRQSGFDPALLQQVSNAGDATPDTEPTEEDAGFSFSSSRRKKKGKKGKQGIPEEQSMHESDDRYASIPQDVPSSSVPADIVEPVSQPESRATISDAEASLGEPQDRRITEPLATVDDPAGDIVVAGEREMDVDEMDEMYKAYKKKDRRKKKKERAATLEAEQAREIDASRSLTISTSQALSDTVDVPQNEHGVTETVATQTETDVLPGASTVSPNSKVQSVFPGLERVKRRPLSVTSPPPEERISTAIPVPGPADQGTAKQQSSDDFEGAEIGASRPSEETRELPTAVLGMAAGAAFTAAAAPQLWPSEPTQKPTERSDLDRGPTAFKPDNQGWSFAALSDQNLDSANSSTDVNAQHDIIRDSGFQEADSPPLNGQSIEENGHGTRTIMRDSGFQETSSPYLDRRSIQSIDHNVPEIHTKQSRESLRSRRSAEPLHISTDTGSDWGLNIGKTRTAANESTKLDPRTPSAETTETPLESTTKNRASYLFQSPPANVRSLGDSEDHATPLAPQPGSDYFHPGAATPDTSVLKDSERSAFSPPPSGPLSPRTALDTILEEHHAPKRSKAETDVGGPELVKALRRTETPQAIRTSRERALSPPTRPTVSTSFPHTGAARHPLSTDEVINRLSWPAIDEENGTVNIDRSLKRKTRVSSDQRSPSVLSSRSNASAGHQFRSPEELRSYSRTSNRSSTPTLRRIDRSLSGDLRAASRRGDSGSAVGARSSPKTIPFEPPPTPPSNDEDVIDGSAARAAAMGDVFQGFGDAQRSQVSPTRPPSVRKRQSMHIGELESKLEQLEAENRVLQDAKQHAEQSREATTYQHDANSQAMRETLSAQDVQLRAKDAEINQIRTMLQPLQEEIARLSEINNGLTEANKNLVDDTNGRYATLQQEHSHMNEQWQSSTRELDLMRQEHGRLTTGMRGILEAEIATAMADKNAEILRLREELDVATEQIRALQVQIQSSRSNDFLTVRDEDYFDGACQKLCQHVQQWVLRFSKLSDSHICRLSSELNDDKLEARLDNAILDGSDVDKLLGDRVKRRDVFMSVVMTMVWEYVFTRYLFGMDREQRQKLKALEKILADVGPPRAVAQWRATTLTLLSKRPDFSKQCTLDTEAVAHEVFGLLCRLLPPPSHAEQQLLSSLQRVIRIAVDLSVEMRTQRAEYIMLPPLQPEYDTNGDLVRKVPFNASLMNERSGMFSSNQELEQERAVVKIVLFPLVVKKGDESGEGEEEIVVCPAQVLVHNDGGRGKKVVRVMSGAMEIDDPRRSRQSLLSTAPGSAAF